MVFTICVELVASERYVLRKRDYGSSGNQGSTHGVGMPGAPGSKADELLYYIIGNARGNNGGVGAAHNTCAGAGAYSFISLEQNNYSIFIFFACMWVSEHWKCLCGFYFALLNLQYSVQLSISSVEQKCGAGSIIQ